MSSGDAADFLGVGLRTLYKFIDDWKLPGYRFGRVIRLKRLDVEAFIDSCRIEPGTLEHLRAEPSTTTDWLSPGAAGGCSTACTNATSSGRLRR